MSIVEVARLAGVSHTTVPNEAAGRLIILCCSGIVVAIGLALRMLGAVYRAD